MTPRLVPITGFDADTQATLDKTLVRGGEPLNVFLTLAHNPRLLKRFNVLGGYYLAKSTLPPREREIVVLRVGALCRCDYEFGQHTLIGRAVGLSDAEIAAIASDPSAVTWSHDERALLDLADELCGSDCRLRDATWDRLRARYDEAALVELVTLAGFYRMLCGFLNTMGVEREPGVPGFPEPPGHGGS